MNTELENREYVIQPNAISRSIYSSSTYARRMMAMAMSKLPPTAVEKKDFTVSFSVTEFMNALGLERGGPTRQLVKAAIEECTGNTIKIWEGEPGRGGTYTVYTWFLKTILSTAVGREIAWDWDKITMKFNPDLAAAIGDFKKNFAKINLLNFGKLQGRYAIRIYEMALSYSGFAGKDGNPKNEWFFEEAIENLKLLFDVDPKKYKLTGAFRTNVIDKPIEEINAAEIGLRIEPEYIRRGRYLHKIKFNCRYVKEGEPVPVQPATETAQEEEALINAFPEEYEKYKADELDAIRKNPELFKFIGHEEIVSKGRAIDKLREAHPDFFKKRRGKK